MHGANSAIGKQKLNVTNDLEKWTKNLTIDHREN